MLVVKSGDEEGGRIYERRRNIKVELVRGRINEPSRWRSTDKDIKRH